MGKKTDAFCDTVQKLTDTISEQTSKYLTACEALARANDEWRKLEKAHDERTLEIQKQFKDEQAQFIKATENDSKIKDLNAGLERIGPILLQARKDRDAAKEALQKSLTQLKDDTKKFAEYINDKERSKNPFKSKNSLPTAKLMIKCAEELIRKTEGLK